MSSVENTDRKAIAIALTITQARNAAIRISIACSLVAATEERSTIDDTGMTSKSAKGTFSPHFSGSVMSSSRRKGCFAGRAR